MADVSAEPLIGSPITPALHVQAPSEAGFRPRRILNSPIMPNQTHRNVPGSFLAPLDQRCTATSHAFIAFPSTTPQALRLGGDFITTNDAAVMLLLRLQETIRRVFLLDAIRVWTLLQGIAPCSIILLVVREPVGTSLG